MQYLLSEEWEDKPENVKIIGHPLRQKDGYQEIIIGDTTLCLQVMDTNDDFSKIDIDYLRGIISSLVEDSKEILVEIQLEKMRNAVILKMYSKSEPVD